MALTDTSAFLMEVECIAQCGGQAEASNSAGPQRNNGKHCLSAEGWGGHSMLDMRKRMITFSPFPS